MHVLLLLLFKKIKLGKIACKNMYIAYKMGEICCKMLMRSHEDFKNILQTSVEMWSTELRKGRAGNG